MPHPRLLLLLILALPAAAQDLELVDPATRQVMETALAAEQKADWKRAAQAWKLVLGRDPGNVPAILGLARCQQAQGDVAGARRSYARLPAEPEAVEALALLVQEEDPAEAARLYQRLTQLRLGDPEAQRRYVLALVRVDPPQARSELDLYLALHEGEPEGRLFAELSLAMRERGDEEGAQEVLERYLAGWPEGALADEARGRLDRLAVERAARDLAVGAGSPLSSAARARVERARRRAAAGQLEVALAELREVVQEAPQAAEAWGALGDVHVHLGRVDEAERAYAWAASLAPEEATWHARLGLLLAERYGGRRNTEADELLARAMALRPTWAELRFRQGLVRQARGDWEGAIASFEEYLAVEAQGSFAPQAHQALADLRRVVPAPAALPAPPQPPPDLPVAAVAHYRIARVYLDQGQAERSREELGRALELAPSWPAALNLDAALLMQAGEEEQAVAAWNRSLSLEPDQPLVRLNLGQRHRHRGERAQAAALLQQAALGGAEDAWYLLALMAWEEQQLWQARDLLDQYFASSTGGISQEAASGLRGRVERRILAIQAAGSGALGGLVLLGGGLLYRRRSGRTLEQLLAKAPEATPDLARLLAAIRHEVLKHNTTLLDEVALALERGDHHAVRWAALRLYGDGRGSEGVLARFDVYLAAIERLGRQHGLRLDLRRRDPVLAPMHAALARLRRLAPRLRSPRRANAQVPAELRELSQLLNVDGYRALGRMVARMGTLSLDRALFAGVDARVRAEPAFDGADLPPLDLELPDQPVPVRCFRGDLQDVLANLLRNALGALVEGQAPGSARLGIRLEEDVDPITGIESVRVLVRDNAPGQLTDAMIHGREIGRGLGLVADLVARHEGSIHVEPVRSADAMRWTKSVVVTLRRAEGEEE